MSKRLQVVVGAREWRRLSRFARAKGLTLSEWVRQTLRRAVTEEPDRDVDKKLAAVRAAARHAFPAPDVPTMLAEIERGYAAGVGK